MLTNLFWVAFGSAVGGSLRYLVTYGFTHLSKPFGYEEISRQSTYWSVLSINLGGCFLIGIIAAFFLIGTTGKIVTTNSALWLFLCVGVLGGYTTFSSFGLHVVELLIDQRIWAGILYVAISVIGGIASSLGGFYIGRFISLHF